MSSWDLSWLTSSFRGFHQNNDGAGGDQPAAGQDGEVAADVGQNALAQQDQPGDGHAELAGRAAVQEKEKEWGISFLWDNRFTHAVAGATRAVGSGAVTGGLYAAKATMLQWTSAKPLKDDLDEKTGSTHFTDFLSKSAPFLSVLNKKGVQDYLLVQQKDNPETYTASFFSSLSEFIDGQDNQLQELINFALLKGFDNLLNDAIANRPSDASRAFPDDPVCEVAMHILQLITIDLTAIESDLKQVEKHCAEKLEDELYGQPKEFHTEIIERNKKEREELIGKELSYVSDKLLHHALPNGPEDLPVRNIPFMVDVRQIIWESLKGKVMPTVIAKVYHLTMDPKQTMDHTSPIYDEQGGYLHLTSQALAIKIMQIVPELVDENQDKIVGEFASDDEEKKWLAERLNALLNTNHPAKIQTFAFAESYLTSVMNHIFSNLFKYVDTPGSEDTFENAAAFLLKLSMAAHEEYDIAELVNGLLEATNLGNELEEYGINENQVHGIVTRLLEEYVRDISRPQKVDRNQFHELIEELGLSANIVALTRDYLTQNSLSVSTLIYEATADWNRELVIERYKKNKSLEQVLAVVPEGSRQKMTTLLKNEHYEEAAKLIPVIHQKKDDVYLAGAVANLADEHDASWEYVEIAITHLLAKYFHHASREGDVELFGELAQDNVTKAIGRIMIPIQEKFTEIDRCNDPKLKDELFANLSNELFAESGLIRHDLPLPGSLKPVLWKILKNSIVPKLLKDLHQKQKEPVRLVCELATEPQNVMRGAEGEESLTQLCHAVANEIEKQLPEVSKKQGGELGGPIGSLLASLGQKEGAEQPWKVTRNFVEALMLRILSRLAPKDSSNVFNGVVNTLLGSVEDYGNKNGQILRVYEKKRKSCIDRIHRETGKPKAEIEQSLLTSSDVEAKRNEEEFIAAFRPLAKELLVKAGLFKECEALYPGIYQEILPKLLVQVYHLSMGPKHQFEQAHLDEFAGGGVLRLLAQPIALQVKQILPETLEENSAKIAEGVGDLLHQEIPSSGLAGAIATLVRGQSDEMNQAWDFTGDYLSAIINHVAYNLAAGSKEENRENILMALVPNLLTLIYEQGKNPQELSKQLLEMTGIQPGHPLYLQAVQDNFLPKFLSEYVRDMTEPQRAQKGQYAAASAVLARDVMKLTRRYLQDNPKSVAELACSKLADWHKTNLIQAYRNDSSEKNLEKILAQVPRKEREKARRMIGDDKIIALMQNGYGPEEMKALSEVIVHLTNDTEDPAIAATWSFLNTVVESLIDKGITHLAKSKGKAFGEDLKDPLAIGSMALLTVMQEELANIKDGSKPENFIELSRRLVQASGVTKDDLSLPAPLRETFFELLQTSILPTVLVDYYPLYNTPVKLGHSVAMDQTPRENLGKKAGGETLIKAASLIGEQAETMLPEQIPTEGIDLESVQSIGYVKGLTRQFTEAFVLRILDRLSDGEDKNALTNLINRFRTLFEGYATDHLKSIKEHDDTYWKLVEECGKIDKDDPENSDELKILNGRIALEKKRLLQKFAPLTSKLVDEAGLNAEVADIYPDLMTIVLPEVLLDLYRQMSSPHQNYGEYREAVRGILENMQGIASRECDRDLTREEQKEAVEAYQKELERVVNEIENSSGLLATDIKGAVQHYISSNTMDIGELIRSAIGEDLPETERQHIADALKGLKGSEWNYLENVTQIVLFKIFGHFAEEAALEDRHDIPNEHPHAYLMSRIFTRLLEGVQENLHGTDNTMASFLIEIRDKGEDVSELEAFVERKNINTVEDVFSNLEVEINNQDKELFVRLIRLRFRAYSRHLVESACRDSLNELLAPLPKAVRPAIYQKITDEILPDFVAKSYRDSMAWNFKKEETEERLIGRFKNNNMVQFSRYIGQLGAVYIPNYLSMSSKDVSEKLYALVQPYVKGVARQQDVESMIAKNAHHIGNDPELGEALPFIEDYIEAATLQFFDGFTKHISQMETGDKPQVLYKNMVEQMLILAKDHFNTINKVKGEESNIRAWRIGKDSMKEGFERHHMLHPALYGEEEKKKYYQDLAIHFMELADLNDPQKLALPVEVREPIFHAIQEGVVPVLIESLLKILKDPKTMNTMLLSSLGVMNTITEDAEKFHYQKTIEQIEAVFTGELAPTLELVDHDPHKAWPKIQNLIQQISHLQKELTLSHEIVDRKIYIYLHEIKGKLELLEPKSAPKQATGDVESEDTIDRRHVLKQIDALLNGEKTTSEDGGEVVYDGMLSLVDEIQEGLKDYVLENDDEQKEFNKNCGELLLTLVEMIPDNFTKGIFKIKDVKNLTAEEIGKAVRRQVNGNTLIKMMSLGVEKGLPSLAEGEWFGTGAERKFIPGKWVSLSQGEEPIENDLHYRIAGPEAPKNKSLLNKISALFDQALIALHIKAPPEVSLKSKMAEKKWVKFVANPNGYTFDLPNSPEAVAAAEKAHLEQHRAIRKKLIDEIVYTFDERVKSAINGFFMTSWFSIQEKIDGVVKIVFGKKGLKRKHKLDKEIDRILIKTSFKALDVVLHPISLLFWGTIHIFVRSRAKYLISSGKLDIHENFFYNLTDTVLLNLFKMPNPPKINDEYAVSDSAKEEMRELHSHILRERGNNEHGGAYRKVNQAVDDTKDYAKFQWGCLKA